MDDETLDYELLAVEADGSRTNVLIEDGIFLSSLSEAYTTAKVHADRLGKPVEIWVTRGRAMNRVLRHVDTVQPE
jgi:hypothetical protein